MVGWPEAHGVALGISVAVHDITHAMGPTEIVPSGRDVAVHCTMTKGAVTIRDIRVPHRGTANMSQQNRTQLGLTLLTLTTQPMVHKPMQYTQLENEPWDTDRLLAWLKGYSVPSYKPLA